MKYGRRDYDTQDPAGLIPENEPVFLIRGQDAAGPDTVRDWAARAKALGASKRAVESARRQALDMEAYQAITGRRRVPDLPD